MFKNKRSAVALVAMGFFVLALSGCQKEEGPAEKAGKEIDKAIGQAGEQMQQAGAKIQDAAREVRK